MAVRILAYTALLWENIIKDLDLRAGDKLPPIFPLVVYGGDRRWTASLTIAGLLDDRVGPLLPYQPSQKYFAIDEKNIEKDVLEAARGAVADFLRVKWAESRKDFARALASLGVKFPAGTIAGNQIMTYLELIWRERFPDWAAQVDAEKKEGSAMFAEALAILDQKRLAAFDEGKAEGKAEGYGLGKDDGLMPSRQALLAMAGDAYNGLPDAWSQVICSLRDGEKIQRLLMALYRRVERDEFEKLLLDG